VEELAEVLAVELDNPEGITNLKPKWRREDQEQALLTLCSGLIAIVQTGGSFIVDFSHFTVREFLSSARLANSTEDYYYINIQHAHTTLAQVCLGILLNSFEENGLSPLVEYSAKHWVTHARSGGVSSCLRKAIEYCMHGFQDLTKRLVNKNPKSLNKRGGFWGTPLVATLATASSNSQASPSPRWWCRRECPWL
jgi:hypothetical protein